IVIGGLTQQSDISSERRLPILGNVPGLGQLFGLDTSTRSKTELYIVVTPHVVRRSVDGAGVPDTPMQGPYPPPRSPNVTAW
ncbi:MAG: hypothetical protein P4M09_25675, partial [Devosia sp.]|nr:hypothetical protein [Devosia sp.]